MEKVSISLQIKTGKKTPVKITGYHFGNDKPMEFSNGKKSTRTKITIQVLKVLETAFREAGFNVEPIEPF